MDIKTHCFKIGSKTMIVVGVTILSQNGFQLEIQIREKYKYFFVEIL